MHSVKNWKWGSQNLKNKNPSRNIIYSNVVIRKCHNTTINTCHSVKPKKHGRTKACRKTCLLQRKISRVGYKVYALGLKIQTIPLKYLKSWVYLKPHLTSSGMGTYSMQLLICISNIKIFICRTNNVLGKLILTHHWCITLLLLVRNE